MTPDHEAHMDSTSRSDSEHKVSRMDTRTQTDRSLTAPTNEAVRPRSRRRCALRPDAQAFDEIRIVTVPRYKTSGLSGDEWRISAAIRFYRKGKLVHEGGPFRDVETACGWLFAEHGRATDEGKGYFAGDGVTCDQEGCAEPATVRYARKFDYCNDGHQHKVFESSQYRHFCEQHRRRGDCGLDDADANYIEEPMEPQSPAVGRSSSGGAQPVDPSAAEPRTAAPAFTPGPWAWDSRNGTPYLVAPNGAVTVLGVSWEPTDPDAHLIAAAPDLYAALKAITDVTRYPAGDCYEIPSDEWRDAIALVYAALAKADGQPSAQDQDHAR